MTTGLAVHRTRDGFAVRSATGRGAYRVRQDWAGRWMCSCPDYGYRRWRSGGVCKHIQAALAAEAEPKD
jgi:hypothetical protein